MDISEYIAKCRMNSYIIKLGVSIPKHLNYSFDIAGLSLVVSVKSSIPATIGNGRFCTYIMAKL